MDDFARPLMYNVPHWAELALYAMIPVVILVSLGGVAWRVRKWWLGGPEPGSEAILATLLARLRDLLKPDRLKVFIQDALFQGRLSRDPFATAMHLAIFWGMVVLAIGTGLATIDQDFTNLPFDFQILQGNVYRLFELALDVFGVALLLGVAMAAYRRYLARPDRLKPAVARISRWDGFPFLLVLLVIGVTGFVAEGLRIAEAFHVEERLLAAGDAPAEQKLEILEQLGMEEQFHLIGAERRQAELNRIASQNEVFPAARWAPVGYALAELLAPLPLETIRQLHQVTWWVHALVAFALIGAIPFTKAFHILSSPINLLLRQPAPVGRLPATVEAGVKTIGDLTWRQLLQVDACTWCGKCQEVCPAHGTGFPLSPRDVVQKLDGVLIRTALRRKQARSVPDVSSGANGGNGQLPTLHGEVISAEELWACCTCRACEDICPVGVEQPRLLVDLRRHLIDQGDIDEGLQDALMNVQRYGNCFGQSGRKRGEWAKSLPFKIKDAVKEDVEYLWFVGDYASYDQRVQGPTRAIAQVFHHLGLDFGILGAKEQNAGNDVRRVGEEGLFDLMREKNCQEFEKATFQKVVTTDPHTYNTLKNEYTAEKPKLPEDDEEEEEEEELDEEAEAPKEPILAGRAVIHYTELLDQFVRDGKLRFAKPLGYTATYHDPCYLGRYNGVYEAPRRVLAALGVTLIEMPRNRQNSFCCGAGGGRIWMKDTPGIDERPAEVRIREALALPGVQYFVVACPKDLAMFQDAVKTVGAEDRLKVVDLGELVLEAIGEATADNSGDAVVEVRHVDT